MSTRIAVECLRCGHRASIRESDLPEHGYATDAPLALITKRMICKECGSKALSAFRYTDDDAPLAPKE